MKDKHINENIYESKCEKLSILTKLQVKKH